MDIIEERERGKGREGMERERERGRDERCVCVRESIHVVGELKVSMPLSWAILGGGAHSCFSCKL